MTLIIRKEYTALVDKSYTKEVDEKVQVKIIDSKGEVVFEGIGKDIPKEFLNIRKNMEPAKPGRIYEISVSESLTLVVDGQFRQRYTGDGDTIIKILSPEKKEYDGPLFKAIKKFGGREVTRGSLKKKESFMRHSSRKTSKP